MKRQWILISGAATMALAGCGGDSSSPPAPTSISYATVINDGLLKGASACLDMNLNGKCDEGEPISAKSDINGKATIVVPFGIDAAKFPVVAEVPADAVDADNPNGTVGTAYTLSAPAGKTGYISPLTTMVQTYLLQNPAATVETATAAVKDQLKLTGSPLDNIAGKTDADAQKAADAGRIIVKIKQVHLEDLKTVIAADPSLTKEQVEALLNKRLLELLDVLQEKLTAGTLSPTDVNAAVTELKDLTLITKDTLKDALDDDKKHGKDSVDMTLPTAGASVRWFNYLNSASNINYFVRQFVASDDDVKDSATSGTYFYTDQRFQMTNNIKLSSGTDWPRNEVYFTGTEWFACPADFKNTATVRNAAGENLSIYCKTYKSRNVRKATDISGLSIKDIITDIRKFPYADTIYGSYKTWGADPATAGLDVLFAAGSKLFYNVSTDIETPLAYSTLSTDKVLQGAATGPLPLATDLDTLVTSFPGNLITDTTRVTSRNSLSIRNITLDVAPDPVTDSTGGTAGLISFQAKRRFSAAFDVTGNKARFYSCKVVDTDAVPGRYTANSSYGCETLSDRTYKIETKADARVLSFAKMPEALIPLWRNDRLLVERGGSVMYGWHTRLVSNRELRLNGVAMDQIRGILSIN